MKKIIIICLIGIILGFLVPFLNTSSINDFPIPVRGVILGLTDNPIEKLFIFGYRLDNQLNSEQYHIKAITWFGLTYADIYISLDGSSGYIERNIFFEAGN